MSDSSSDTESSSGWTIITNEGSDIETLGSETVVENKTEQLERPPVEEVKQPDTPEAFALVVCTEEPAADSLEDTLEQQTIAETLCASEDRENVAEKEQGSLLSFSDHSDIVTLADMREDEHADVEDAATGSEDLYMGTSSSSHYSFIASETGLPVQQAAVVNSSSSSSSSEDEARRSPSSVPRRRRVRKNTTGMEEEEEQEPGPKDELERKKVKEEEKKEEDKVDASRNFRTQGCKSIVITCVMLLLVTAVCMGVGHIFGTYEVPERPKFVCGGVFDLFHEEPFTVQALDHEGRDHEVLAQLPKLPKKMHEVRQPRVQKKDLKHRDEEMTYMLVERQRLSVENKELKLTLEGEKKSLSTLQKELRNLRNKIRDLEAQGAGVDSVLSENTRMKEQLEEEQQVIRNLYAQKEELAAETQALKMNLKKEREVTGQLRSELDQRLLEMEQKLSFEQQRSDLWERLYVETKETRAKGDTESKVKKPREGMAGKVKDTFDAVKNSSKEFVHHHKEQIKKAKEAVKENLRKFSDSVKSTFRHFKDSASTLFKKVRGFSNKKRDQKTLKEPWQHRHHKPFHKHTQKEEDSSSRSNYNTRKPGPKVQQDQWRLRLDLKGCDSVFDCAYQESMSFFNVATEPVRADEFHQLLQSYVQQEVDHFHKWKELEVFVNGFFHNGIFIHDQMLFTDFVCRVEDYLADMALQHHGLHDRFGDLDDYVYRHFFGDAYTKNPIPRGPFDKPVTNLKEELRSKHHQRKQQKAKPWSWCERKRRSGKNSDTHMADVKIELGPMPFDPKY
ncbi:cell cycle progression protein 1 isoform X2 [Cynoglossus semilaevis]|uniref:cell cycle progression protein 1 isoform X2 n=1 Tax=Cynoglossus semilaevis TaxID=244447 RepID=UPI000495D396|nr:cell cycle progression protein 1 isoform X2 [Cynoglossus semilaevis]